MSQVSHDPLHTNGLGEFKKRRDAFGFLCKQSANVLLLQETHWKTEVENGVRSQWGFDCIVAEPDCGSQRVAVLFKNNV